MREGPRSWMFRRRGTIWCRSRSHRRMYLEMVWGHPSLVGRVVGCPDEWCGHRCPGLRLGLPESRGLPAAGLHHSGVTFVICVWLSGRIGVGLGIFLRGDVG